MPDLAHAAPRRTLPAPVARLAGMAAFVVAATLGWRLVVGDDTCLALSLSVLIYLAGDILLAHRRERAGPTAAT